MCQLFGKSPQAYYKHKRRPISEKAAENEVLEIVKYYRSLMPLIGGLKLYVIAQGIMGNTMPFGRDRFLSFLHRHHLIIPPRKPRHTTNSNHIYMKYPNCIKGVNVQYVNQVWVSDITYIYTIDDGFCYLHLVTDYYSRAILGAVVSPTLETIYSQQALQQAITQAGGGNLCGTTHHSDRGVQYASDAYVLSLKEHHIRISMTEDSNPTDNGLAERVNGILKTEWIYNRTAYRNLREAQIEIAHIIDLYNNVRPHRSIDMCTPMSVYLQDASRTPQAAWNEHNWSRAAPSSLCHAWQREEGNTII